MAGSIIQHGPPRPGFLLTGPKPAIPEYLTMKACSIIDAPSDLGLRHTGVDRLPDALREAGLLEGLPDVR